MILVAALAWISQVTWAESEFKLRRNERVPVRPQKHCMSLEEDLCKVDLSMYSGPWPPALYE